MYENTIVLMTSRCSNRDESISPWFLNATGGITFSSWQGSYDLFTLHGIRTGTWNMYITLCTVHTTQGQGQGTIVVYCAHSDPRTCPVPVPVQCVWAIRGPVSAQEQRTMIVTTNSKNHRQKSVYNWKLKLWCVIPHWAQIIYDSVSHWETF